MALGNSSIQAVETFIGSIETASERAAEESSTFNHVMNNDDFMKFAGDTSFGAKTQEKLGKAVEGIGMFSSSIATLKQRTTNFLNKQREENNRHY